MPKNKTILSNRLYRYFPYYLDEAEESLESMLSILSIISREHYRVTQQNYCRAIAWIKTQDGKDHLVCAASLRNKHHAEEALVSTLYRLYENDPRVITEGKFIHIEEMYIDNEPCTDRRYGANHHCQLFFSEAGHMVDTIRGRKKLAIRAKGKVYFNAPQLEVGVGSQIRSEDSEREAILLGCNFRKAYSKIHLWDKCLVVSGKDVHSIQEINLEELFQHALNANTITDETQQVCDELIRRIQENDFPPQLSNTTKDTLVALFSIDNEEKIAAFCKSIANNWNLKLLVKNILFNSSHVNAIRELQTLKDIIFPNLVVSEKNQEKNEDNANDEEEILLLNKTEEEDFVIQDDDISVLFANKLTLSQKLPPELHAQCAQMINLFQKLLDRPDADDLPEFFANLKGKPYALNVLFADRQKFIPLITMLYKGKSQHLRLYLQELKEALCKKLISKSDFCQIFNWKFNADNFTPLHYCLLSRNTETLVIYLVELRNAVENGYITPKQYVDILLASTLKGYTPLHRVFVVDEAGAGSAEIYIRALHEAIEKGWLDPKVYANLFICTNGAGVSPLSFALNFKHANAALYFYEMERVLDKQWLPIADYKSYLKKRQSYHYTILQESLASDRGYNSPLLLRHLERLVVSGKITPQDYTELFLDEHVYEFSCIGLVLLRGNREKFNALICALEEAVDKKWITPDEYVALLIKRNKDGFTPLHNALTGDLLSAYVDALDRAFANHWMKGEIYGELLIARGKPHITCFVRAFNSNKLENLQLYIEKLHCALREKWITQEQYLAELNFIHPNGYTLIQTTLAENNVDNLRLYLQEIERVSLWGWLSVDEYTAIFTQKPIVGSLSALSYSIFRCKPQAFLISMEAIERGIQNGKLNPHACMQAMIQRNDLMKYTPVENFIFTKNVNGLKVYLRMLKKAVTQGWITPQEYAGAVIPASTNKYQTEEIHLLYYSYLLSLKKYANYAEKDFENLHYVQNKHGFTALHQVCLSSDKRVIEHYINFIIRTCPNYYRKIFRTLFATPNKVGNYPYCPHNEAGFEEAKSYLLEIGEKYNISVFRGKRKFHEETSSDHSLQSAKKSKQNHDLNFFRLSPIRDIEKLNLFPLIGNANDIKSLAIKLDTKQLNLTVEDVDDDTDENFRTYFCRDEDRQRHYVVQVKAKPQSKEQSIEYNFTSFKREKLKDDETMLKGCHFIMAFTCPINATVILPTHLYCFAPPSIITGQIKGEHERIESITAHASKTLVLR